MTTTPPPGDPSPDEGIPSESPDLRAEQIAPPPAPAEPTPPRRLYRSRSDSWLGGVAGGLAEYFDTDPTLVRVAFVILAIVSGGLGIIGYIAAWIVVPESPKGAPAAARRSAGGNAGIVWGALLVLVGLLLLASQLDLDIDFAIWEVAAATALILVGLFMAFEARRGLHGGLLTLALVLTAVLGFARIADVNLQFDGAFGDTRVRVQSMEDLRDSYSHAFGSLTVDLRDLEIPAGRTVRVDVDIVFGDAVLYLPPDVPARIRAESVFGSIDGTNVDVEGIVSNRDYTPPGWSDADTRIDVSFSTVFGSGRIR